jgi:selenocysteine lyase/cysteine desulfurase
VELSFHFSEFYRALGAGLHCTAHSHHPWPDVTRAAQLACWDDAVGLTDRKWDKIFGEVIPEAQRHIARHLNIVQPEQIAFAPNTHEFVVRLYSCLDWSRRQRVLTSAHEFHSFARQTRRLEETGRLAVTHVGAQPYETFVDRFCAALSEPYDMVWLSHVFFDSGFVVEHLEQIVAACRPDTLIVFDGYHAFAAMPVDVSRVCERAFYVGGGYKYAMTGEGACFLIVPPGNTARPLSTGWFSDFAGLESRPAWLRRRRHALLRRDLRCFGLVSLQRGDALAAKPERRFPRHPCSCASVAEAIRRCAERNADRRAAA